MNGLFAVVKVSIYYISVVASITKNCISELKLCVNPVELNMADEVKEGKQKTCNTYGVGKQ